MKRYLFGIALIVAIIRPGVLQSQSISDLRINEVMLVNQSNYMDNYGNRSAWIEIMNLGYNKVNIANCYLTDNLNEPKKYRIPSGDPLTLIPLRQFVVFFADGITQHGASHLNFTLDSTKRFIALISPDAKTILDSITIPALKANTTYCRIPDGSDNWTISETTTPKSTNDVFTQKVSAGEKFRNFDPTGVIMAISAMLVVFSALLVLYRIFRTIGKINQRAVVRKQEKAQQPKIAKNEAETEISGEVFAAISTALYMHETESHDRESEIITIQRISRHYSPWSSKFYGLRQIPTRTVMHQQKK
ncbi:MAG: OadG family protein [Bacteroidales bacterium]|nr:OadG family protein [Bacteroidales bacterium]